MFQETVVFYLKPEIIIFSVEGCINAACTNHRNARVCDHVTLATSAHYVTGSQQGSGKWIREHSVRSAIPVTDPLNLLASCQSDSAHLPRRY